MKTNKKLIVKKLGSIAYGEAWDYQTKLFQQNVELKLENRRKEGSGEKLIETTNYLLFCEHPHVYTLGKSGDISHLLLNEKTLEEKNISFYKSNRGGDITYHGPGQIVGYPILDLDYFTTDIHLYLRNLEEVIILTLADFGINAGRIPKLTGVWLDHQSMRNPRKICAMGVKMSRWVTMHGFALNVNTNLSYFDHIVPCGIADKAVTSLALELGKSVDKTEVEDRLLQHFTKLFEIETVEQKPLTH